MVPGLGVERCGLLESLLSGSVGAWFYRMSFPLLSPELSLAASFYNRKERARSTWVSCAWSLLWFSPVAAWRWEWRSVLAWRDVLARFGVVEVVGVLVDV